MYVKFQRVARTSAPASGCSHSMLRLQRQTANQAKQRVPQVNAEEFNVVADAAPSTCIEHDFSRIPVFSQLSARAQSKLSVNTPGDLYEQEADGVADRVMSMPAQQTQRSSCACGGACPKCKTSREHKLVQTKQTGSDNAERLQAPPIVHEILNSPGQPLDTETRAFMETRFGHDFSKVRIHADSKSAASALSVQADAYTVGHDVVFGQGKYRPYDADGKRLLAHELTHVCQQSAGPTASVQRQAAPAPATAAHSDAVVEQLIKDAFARNGNILEAAFRDLQSRRCLSENCGDENLAAAEHYLFARYMTEDQGIPATIMEAFILGYSGGKLLGAVPSLCTTCPVTPTSSFQVGWAMKGAEDGSVYAWVPMPPV